MARFCTKCGRPLQEGEVCNCTAQNNTASQGQPDSQQGQPGGQQYYQQGQPGGQQYYQQGQPGGQQYYQQGQPGGQQYYQQGPTKEMEWLNKQKDVIVSGTKSMFSEILPIIKAPVTRVKKICESNSPAVGIEFIIAKTIVSLLIVIISMLVLAGKIEEATGGYVEADLPYFQMILTTLIVTAGIDFLEAVILKAFTGAFGGTTNFSCMINVVGARCIYDIFNIVIFAILFSIAWEVGIGAFALLSPISVYIQFAAYQGCVPKMNPDKRPYAYFLAKLCMNVICGLVIYLIARNFITQIFSSAVGGFF